MFLPANTYILRSYRLLLVPDTLFIYALSPSLIHQLRSLSITFKMWTSVAAVSIFAAAVSAHGNITSPPARQAGTAMATLCGQTAVDNVNADPTIPIEDLGTINADCK